MMSLKWIAVAWACCVLPVRAQLLNETFDFVSAAELNTNFFSNGDRIFFGISGSNPNFGTDSIPSGIKAYDRVFDNFLTGMRLDGLGAELPVQISWESIDISNLTGLVFKADFAEYVDSPGHIDSHDFILVEYQIDHGGYQPLLSFVGADFNTPNYNGVFREDTDFDGIGDGLALNASMQRFEKQIPDIGQQLDLRISFSVNAYEEDFALDNVILLANEIADTTAPQFLPYANILTHNELDSCGTFVEFNPPYALDETDDEDIQIYQVQGIPSGSFFPVGINEVVFEAKDNAGNTAQKSFVVEVEDRQAPEIFYEEHILVQSDEDSCSAQVFYDIPTAIDNCSVTSNIEIIQVSGLGSGSYFEVGEHYETFLAIDEFGNISACAIRIEVLASMQPKYACLSENIKVSVNNGGYYVLPLLGAQHGLHWTDYCNQPYVHSRQFPEPGLVLYPGIHEIKMDLYDKDIHLDTCYVNLEIVSNQQTHEDKEIVVYPNPTANLVYKESSQLFEKIEVYNGIGKLLKQFSQFPIDLSEFPVGTYYLKLYKGSVVSTVSVLKRN